MYAAFDTTLGFNWRKTVACNQIRRHQEELAREAVRPHSQASTLVFEFNNQRSKVKSQRSEVRRVGRSRIKTKKSMSSASALR